MPAKKSAKAETKISSSDAGKKEDIKNIELKTEPVPESAEAIQQKPVQSVLEGVKKAKETQKARKFEQTWTLGINLKGLDLKRPENRFNYNLPLPKGSGKTAKVAVFADLTASEAKQSADLVITKGEIEGLASNKKKMKKIARQYDIFLAEVSLMASIGKSLGSVLGPKGKLPRPLPPKIKLEPFIKSSGNIVRIAVKESPVLHIVVGSEKMSVEDVAANAEAVLNSIKDKLPKGLNNIKSVFVKLTMGPAVKVPVK